MGVISRLRDVFPSKSVFALRALYFFSNPIYAFRKKRSVRRLADEIANLSIAEAGLDEEGHPYILLDDNKKFIGHHPEAAHYKLYDVLDPVVQLRIPRTCIRVAEDVICRFKYPHAVSTICPPYPHFERLAMHRQHQDTIDDILRCSNEKKKYLKEQFEIRSGDVILDVGAFIGFGAMRLSRIVGPQGRIISIEVMPENQSLFKQNIKANEISNVEMIGTAAWNECGVFPLHCDAIQRNSMVSKIIRKRTEMVVHAKTIDHVVRETRLNQISLVSLTINGAEPEAIEGMTHTLEHFRPKLLVSGWYKRGKTPIHQIVIPMLKRLDYHTVLGRCGRVYAW